MSLGLTSLVALSSVGGLGLALAQEQAPEPSRSAQPPAAAPAASLGTAPITLPPDLPRPAPAVPIATPPASTAPAAAPQPGRLSQPAQPRPLRPDPAGLATPEPRRFDRSLDELVRDGVVTQAERDRIRSGAMASPVQAPAHRQACRSGALSEQECNTGVVVRWRGRSENQSWPLDPSDPAALDAAREQLQAGRSGWSGAMGEVFTTPMTTPLTVPVASLLGGDGSSLRLADVFAITPRPAPVAGNGNRSLLFPLIGAGVNTSGFGYRLHPILASWLMHTGIDLAAPTGAPVVASLGGKVVSSGEAGGYGLVVELEHDNPRRRTLYAHLSELYVKAGDRVRQGEVIGRVGSTGLSTGPHLHFELRLPSDGGWVAVDPGGFEPGADLLNPLGSDVIAQMMGQLLQRLERPDSIASEAGPLGG
ncbi:peptidoglycan DD-metalloendopeptidase family protein [Cyanobium sp. ATX 6A2]|uniref:M23 family metallopeptidase n=1 Tax=Cyanobium sp. ATX 6A2 TaxID=2823700 RepID=UPI0020CF0196|nr:peptidoglycan DD-metalloendopeptidase family protein [Cyanobium sp. ATX 6A2]